ncbi:hypothetical protein SO802_012330 [Lithocarpus litseifolius]|uniref:DUF4228 domain-containing protein n=1 Tax=Lithocarpus litseifolius TaxID=425828 RepID=A0AAW2D382_9ROSI
MGIIKYFNLQMIPWCFHLMGNHVSCMQLQPEPEPKPSSLPVGSIKLIKSDGLVKIYHRPIHASEVMVEFPKHLVCRSDSIYIGQKIPALSENDELQPGHKYFLLPKHFFQSVLSFVTIASFASSSHQQESTSSPLISKDSRNAFLKKAATCQPFDIQKTTSGCLRIRVSDEFISQLLEEGKMREENEEKSDSSSKATAKSVVCTTPQLQKEYQQLVGSRLWKPKLETIKEKEKRKLSSFGIKRRKKSQPKGPQKTLRSEHHLHVTCTKPPSKAKIKIKSRK